MRKMKADSLPELVTMAARLGLPPAGPGWARYHRKAHEGQAVTNSIPASQPAFARTNCYQAAAVIAFQAAWESM
jgi:hypothetical protein